MAEKHHDIPADTSYFLHQLESNVFLYTRILIILGLSSYVFLIRNILFYYSVYDIAKYYLYIYIAGCIGIWPVRMAISYLFKRHKFRSVNRLIILSAFIIFLLLVLLSVLDSIRIKVYAPVNDYNFTGYIVGLFIVGFVLRLEWKVSFVMYAVGMSVFLLLYYVYSPRVLSIPSVLPFSAMNALAMYFSYAREKFYHILYEDKNDLLHQTFRDSLTQSFNRRYMKRAIHQSFAHKIGTDITFSCIFADIDFFKEVNDEYGHDKGDKILIEFAKLLQTESRSIDSVIRYGGEEFLIILSNTHLEEAKKIAERIRRRVEELEFCNGSIKITASFGVTEAQDTDTEESIVQRADSLLYTAKRDGRNKVCVG